MSYADDFQDTSGWNAVDVSERLNTANGKKFLAYLRSQGIGTVVRYYASTPRPKTLTPDEAKLLSDEGFGILPVFQDSSRKISDFSAATGKANAGSAMEFADRVGQPKGKGSTILFAVDADYSSQQIDGPIIDYFAAVKAGLKDDFRIGAYGSGAVLSKLMAQGLISVAWLSMSRAFVGTREFFYANSWHMRQLPPSVNHGATGIGYDRDVLRASPKDLGAFQVDQGGRGVTVGAPESDATLGNMQPLDLTEQAAAQGEVLLVTTDGVRLRRTPNGQVIGDLTLADRVVATGPADAAGWRPVVTPAGQAGVVFGTYLRAPKHPAIERLIHTAVDEWLRFDKGLANEKKSPYAEYIREMWAALGQPYDGRSDVPWSAAFISWVVRRSGPPYAAFRFSASHSAFVNDAIKARIIGDPAKPFWAYRTHEQKPALGDIIQRNRSGNQYSYSFAENHSQYDSHSDIVVEVTPDVVRVMGGNVTDTVKYGRDPQEYHLDAQGYLMPNQKIICLLKNRAADVQ